MKSINWKEHLVSLVVVILGITIAFNLETWKENREEDRMENLYFEGLKSDLEYDFDLLDTLIIMDMQRQSMLDRLTQASIGQYTNYDSISIFIGYLQFHVPFSPQGATYEAITTSGNLEIIRDFNLRSQIIKLYSQWYQGTEQYDKTLIDYTDQFVRPFVLYEIEYFSNSKVDPAFLQKPAFRNIIFSYKYLFEARLSFYKMLREEVGRMREELESGGLGPGNY